MTQLDRKRVINGLHCCEALHEQTIGSKWAHLHLNQLLHALLYHSCCCCIISRQVLESGCPGTCVLQIGLQGTRYMLLSVTVVTRPLKLLSSWFKAVSLTRQPHFYKSRRLDQQPVCLAQCRHVASVLYALADQHT